MSKALEAAHEAGQKAYWSVQFGDKAVSIGEALAAYRDAFIAHLAEAVISRTIERLQKLPHHAGRPAWTEIVADEMRAAISALPRRETEGPDEKRLQECEKHLREWRLIALNDAVRNRRVAKWLSAALEDPSTCEEMKADVRAWFAANQEPTHE